MGDAVVWWYRGIDWCERSERLRSRGTWLWFEGFLDERVSPLN